MPIDQEGHSVAQDSTNQGLPTMNRWLNVNVRLPLRRTRGFIALPAFDIASAGRTYSEIVGVFNYTSTNNFTLKDYTKITTNGTYTLCIAYANSDSSVVRYVLAKGLHDNNLSYPPTYAGQIIKKNFRLEVWDGTDHVDAVQAATLQMNTSVLSLVVDTRSGVDFELCSASALCTSQNTTNELQIYVPPPQTNLSLWLENHSEQQYVTLASGSKVATWQDRSPNAAIMVAPVDPTKQPDFFGDVIPGTKYELQFLNGEYLLGGPIATSIAHIFLLYTAGIGNALETHTILKLDDLAGNFLTVEPDGGGNITVSFSLGAVVLANYSQTPNNQVQLLEINITGEGVGNTDGFTGIVKSPPTPVTPGPAIATPKITLGDQGGGTDAAGNLVYGVLAYSTLLTGADRDLAIQYMLSLAAGMTSYFSPLEFAPCTTLTLNT